MWLGGRILYLSVIFKLSLSYLYPLGFLFSENTNTNKYTSIYQFEKEYEVSLNYFSVFLVVLKYSFIFICLQGAFILELF